MPTYERRFFLGQKVREMAKQEEAREQYKETEKPKGSKGSRTSKVSGEALKTQIKGGNLPLN